MKRRDYKMILAVEVLLLTILTSCHRLCKEEAIGEVACAAAIQVEEDTMQIDVAADMADVRRPDVKIHVKRGQSLAIRTKGLMLTAIDAAVRHEADYSVTSLMAEELPPLPQGMTNMTAATAGYRLLPGGEHFSPYAELRMTYDPERLPEGYTPEDIYTSYYDTATVAWVRLERVEVDTIHHEIVSLTTHFTDFINELLKAPEIPETQVFVPTAMSNLEAVSPMDGLPMVQPPTANNNGTANVSYPIVIPAGRNGMQPNLSLNYSSSGGSGWLGVGWDIPVSSITLDTRWGVPRYDARYETEIYLLNGEQLVAESNGELLPMPHRTNQQVGRLSDGTRYHARTGDAHDSIIRHGNTPKNYWWEVVDRNGITSYYGRYADSSRSALPATLCNDNGDIAKWVLTETRDLYGNCVRYYYDRSSAHGGRQIYLDSIAYTGHNNVDGYYTISFCRVENMTSDVQVVCNNGFKEVSSQLLNFIFVQAGDSIITAYHFETENGKMSKFKNRLTKVTKIDSILGGLNQFQNNSCHCIMNEGDSGSHNLEDHGIGMSDSSLYEYGHWDTVLDCYKILKGNPLPQGYDSIYNRYMEWFSHDNEWRADHQKQHDSDEAWFNDHLDTLLAYGNSYADTCIKRAVWYYDGPNGSDSVPRNPNQFHFEDLREYIGATTEFSYFDAPSSDSLFGTEIVSKDLKTTDVHGKLLTSAFQHSWYNRPTALGFSSSHNWSIGGTAAVGGGPVVCLTTLSLGGNYTYGQSSSESLMALVDLDGDGLADKVYLENGSLKFCRQKQTQNGEISYNSPLNINGIDCFQQESNHSNTFGLQAAVGVSGGINWTKTKSTTSIYFADVNGDGLMDLVNDGQVWFNSLTGADRIPTFSRYNAIESEPSQSHVGYAIVPGADTCGGIIFDGQVSDSINCHYRWVEDSVFAIDIHDTAVYLQRYANTQDTNVVFICDSIGKMLKISEAYIFQMEADSHVLSNEQMIEKYGTGWQGNLAGYWRWWETHRQDKEYKCNAIRYVYRMDCTYFDDSPNTEAVKVWVAPKTGEVEVVSEVGLLEDTSESRMRARHADGIIFDIQHSSQVRHQNQRFYPFHHDTILFSGRLDSTSYYPQERLNSRNIINVCEGDMLFFRLRSRLNHNFDSVYANHTICYTDERETIFNSGSDYVVSGKQYFQAPADGSYTIDWEYTDPSNSTRLYVFVGSGSQIFAPNAPHSPLTGYISQNENISFAVVSMVGANVDWGKVVCRPHVYYEPESDAQRIDIQGGRVFVSPIDDTISVFVPAAMMIVHRYNIWNDPFYHSLFGPLYNGWGQFAYNSQDKGLASDTIRLDKLTLAANTLNSNTMSQLVNNSNLTQGNFDHSSSQEEFERSTHIYSPMSQKNYWTEMTPDPEHQAWVSYGRQNYIQRGQMSNSMNTRWYCNSSPDLGQDDTPDPQPEIVMYDDPVPPTYQGTPAKAIRKVNRSESCSWSLSAAIAGISGSSGENYIESDYLDLNGDRYPDIVGSAIVQYTKPWGGLGETKDIGITHGNTSTTKSAGASFGGSPILMNRMLSSSMSNAKFNLQSSGSGTVSISGGGNLGTDFSNGTWMDMNGDGLADFIDNDGNVRLNTGYRFLGCESWNFKGARYGGSGSVSGSIGFNSNIWQGSIQAGAGISTTYNQTNLTMIDVNGDGLPDQVWRNISKVSELADTFAGIGHVSTFVAYNLGNGKWSGKDILDIGRFNASTSYSESLNLGATLGFTVFGSFKVTVGLNGTPYSGSVNRDYYQLVDVNADGLPDLVHSDNEQQMSVRYNMTGKANLLKKITNFTNSTIDLDYTSSDPSYDQPSRNWLLTRVVTKDPLNPNTISASSLNDIDTIECTTKTEYEYTSPHYSRYERTSYGYATVTTWQFGPSDNVYRIIRQDFNNQDYIRKGKLMHELTTDGHNNKYVEKYMECTYIDYESGQPVGDTANCPGMMYPSSIANFTAFYEGQGTPQLVVGEKFEYDSYHNVVRYTDMGDTNNHDDGVVVHFNYLHGLRHNLIGLRSEYTIASLADTNTILRHATFAYDTAKGRLTRQNLWNGITPSQFDFEYDTYGNLTIGIQLQNGNGERVRFNYQYDSVVHSYPIRIENHFGEEMFTQYDYRFGKPIRVTDPGGNSMDYSYDFAGRLTSVTSPLNSSGVPSLTNQYHPVNYYHGIHPNGYTYSPSPSGHSYSVSQHNDDQGSIVTKTVVITDASGRAIQTKKGITILDTLMMQVSGRVFTDVFGRAIRQYDPVVEIITDSSLGNWNSMYDPLSLSTISYDVLDRKTNVAMPLGVTTQNAYSIGINQSGLQCFITTTTDPNGNITQQYSDYDGRQVQVTDATGGITLMHYDNLGQLDSTSDPEGFTTYYSYDNLGRLVFRDHPDAGLTRYVYDPAGNIIQETNPLGQINYDYTYYRLLYKRYNYMTGNDVAYTYGASGNETGRPVRIEDGSGTYECQYDALGNVVDETRTIAIPHHGNVYQFRMRYQYDSWGRMLGMTYPDGERIDYTYQWGGDLYAMRGDKNGDTRTYIKGTFYNIYGQKSLVEYGNQTKTSYTYDALHRLSRLQSRDANGTLMQDIDYTFDNASNVTGIRNRAGVVNTLGGTYENAYKYDELHRLINSRGNGAIGNYNIDLSYSPSGRLMTKFRDNSSVTLSATADMAYGYCDDYQPHAVKRMFDYNNGMLYDMRWDRAGNLGQVSIADHTYQFESGRFLFWTEDSRMHTVVDDRYYSYYAYDYSGERRLKLTGENSLLDINADIMSTYSILDEPTLYPSPYMVLTNNGYTKHYYTGAERVAARLGGGGLDAMGQTIGNEDALQEKSTLLFDQSLEQACNRVLGENDLGCIMRNQFAREEFGRVIDGTPSKIKAVVKHDCHRFTDMVATMSVDRGQGREPDVFFYHSDHLGSASWITDNSGDAVQHLQYLPYGEPYINQRLSGYNERFTFTGKERDAETGYGYFGARYMDHELMTMWLSVDPMADKYPGISPYAYCAWNPVKLVDPDGRDIWEINKQGELIWKKASNTDVIMSQEGDFVEVADGILERSTNGISGRSYSKNDGFLELKFDGNENNSSEVFEFLADHSSVEFSLMKFQNSSDNEGAYYITSSFSQEGDDHGDKRANNQITKLLSHTHNHPTGNAQQSNKDIRSFINADNVDAYVYVPKGKNIGFRNGGYHRIHSSERTKHDNPNSGTKMMIEKGLKKYKVK